MKKEWALLAMVGILVAALAVFAGCGKKAQTSKSTSSAIKIKDFAFNPGEIAVSPGTKVTWINEDSTVHTVTGADFNSGEIKPAESYNHTFSSPGTYNYHCSIHPSMTGKVTVTGGGSSSGTQ